MSEEPNEKTYPSKPCTKCGVLVAPFQIPALFDLPARWVPPSPLCEACDAKAEHEKQRFEDQKRIHVAFNHAMLTPRFKARSFETFEVNKQNQLAWETAFNFKPNVEGHSLLFYGPCGIGKTHLAAAIANRFVGKVGVLYISCPELLSELREIIRVRGKSSEKFHLAKTVDLLVLDDIGTEKPTDWVKETLFLLINHRYEFQRSTIFTTNCDFEELEHKLGNRIVSRIVEMCTAVSFNNKNFRTEANNRKGGRSLERNEDRKIGSLWEPRKF